MSPFPVYLDSAATTRVSGPVAELACRLMLASANAGSRTHGYGVEAQRELTLARGRVADVAGCAPREVVFTSGATEATNLALQGLAPFGRSSGRRHVVTTAVEHKATLEPLARLEREGFEVVNAVAGQPQIPRQYEVELDDDHGSPASHKTRLES